MVVEMLVVCRRAEQSLHNPKLFPCSQAPSTFVMKDGTGCEGIDGGCFSIGKHVDKPWVLAYTTRGKESDRS
jgi:hypothetical protein